MARCVETNEYGTQCENNEPCTPNHWDRWSGFWPAASRYCGRDTVGNTSCVRDIEHKGECRPRGWLGTKQTIVASEIDPAYLLWAGAVVGVLVAIGQLAAERADQKQKSSRFNWLEVD